MKRRTFMQMLGALFAAPVVGAAELPKDDVARWMGGTFPDALEAEQLMEQMWQQVPTYAAPRLRVYPIRFWYDEKGWNSEPVPWDEYYKEG